MLHLSDPLQSQAKGALATWSFKLFQCGPLCFLMTCLLMKPAYFGEIPWLSRIFQIGLIAVSLLSIALVVLTGNVRWPHVALAAFYAVICLATLLGSDIPLEAVKTAMKAMGMCCFVTMGMAAGPKRFLRGMRPVFELLTYATLVTVILFPQGLYGRVDFSKEGVYFLLGHRNGMINVLLPGILLAFLEIDSTEGTRLRWLQWGRTILQATVTGALIYLTHSITSLVGYITFAIVFLVLFLLRNTYAGKRIGVLLPVTIMLLVFVGIVILRAHEAIWFLLENILQRSITMSGRTALWDRAFELIQQKPFLGWGFPDVAMRDALIAPTLNSFHNIFLDLLFEGGVMAFGCFCWFLVCTWRGARPCRYTMLYKVFISVFCSYGVMMNFEVFAMDSLIMPLMVFMLWYALPQVPSMKTAILAEEALPKSQVFSEKKPAEVSNVFS